MFLDFMMKALLFFIVMSMQVIHAEESIYLRGQFGKWDVYKYSDTKNSYCYALSVPTALNPSEGVNHGTNFFIVTPKRGKKDYVPEIVMGYPLNEKVMTSIEVIGRYSDGKIFQMKSIDDRAVFENRHDDGVLVNAMMKGREVLVSARSRRGTDTRHIYSLNGLSSALEEAKDCE
ncbi:hypothetical protein [Candidatus Liberibacter sp.]|uniref:hypothetical protein n=1 Tax=Candidatus Liberibacter sp. TaxID=34022 RepID=UPI0015F516E9|nr:hypothetical protein [Candidatus Liberibacter sp.]MBA5724361.1 hypothetical protein [Candidatus Liberibacter sp.]